MKIEPVPTSEEAAAIVAALEMLGEVELEDSDSLNRSRWMLAGLFGHSVPTQMKFEGSLWSYSSWEGLECSRRS